MKVRLVEGEEENFKVTTRQDLLLARQLCRGFDMRIGHGYDVHRLTAGRKLILGGVEIPFELGLEGHSDADVLLHAVMDALLGAAGLRDIGQHFPDTDPGTREFLPGSSWPLWGEAVLGGIRGVQRGCDHDRPEAEAAGLHLPNGGKHC